MVMTGSTVALGYCFLTSLALVQTFLVSIVSGSRWFDPGLGDSTSRWTTSLLMILIVGGPLTYLPLIVLSLRYPPSGMHYSAYSERWPYLVSEAKAAALAASLLSISFFTAGALATGLDYMVYSGIGAPVEVNQILTRKSASRVCFFWITMSSLGALTMPFIGLDSNYQPALSTSLLGGGLVAAYLAVRLDGEKVLTWSDPVVTSSPLLSDAQLSDISTTRTLDPEVFFYLAWQSYLLLPLILAVLAICLFRPISSSLWSPQLRPASYSLKLLARLQFVEVAWFFLTTTLINLAPPLGYLVLFITWLSSF